MSSFNINLISSFTKKNKIILNLKLIFILTVLAIGMIAYVEISTKIIADVYGPNVKHQIDKQFAQALKQRYECLFLGSSEIYHGINPDMISTPSYNFAFGEETFNQQWNKIAYLTKNKVQYKYLILGLDYSDFSVFQDRKNYAYKEYFDEEYFYDYEKIKSIRELNDSFNHFVKGQYIDKIADFIKIVITKTPFTKEQDEQATVKGLLKDNGQMIYPNIPELKESKRYVITETPKRLLLQEKYFDKIIKYTKDKKIKLILVVPPKYRSYDKKIVKEYDEYIKNKIKGTNIVFVNYQDSPSFKYFDFYDDTHLTRKGADKFSKLVDTELIKLKR